MSTRTGRSFLKTLGLISLILMILIQFAECQITIDFDEKNDANGWYGEYYRVPINENGSDYVLKWDSRSKCIYTYLKNTNVNEDGEMKFSWMQTGTFANIIKLKLYIDGNLKNLPEPRQDTWISSPYIRIAYDPNLQNHNVTWRFESPNEDVYCPASCLLNNVELDGLEIANNCGNCITNDLTDPEIAQIMKSYDEIKLSNRNCKLDLSRIFSILHQLQTENESKVSTIFFDKGTYETEALCINANRITLSAMAKGEVIFDGEGYEYNIALNEAHNLIVKDLIFSNSYNGIIMEKCSGCELKNNDINFKGGTGICVFNSSSDNKIHDNLIESNFPRSSGIWSKNSTNNCYNGNSIEVSNINYFFDRQSYDNEIFIKETEGNVVDNETLYWISCNSFWLCDGSLACDTTRNCADCGCLKIGDAQIQLSNIWILA